MMRVREEVLLLLLVMRLHRQRNVSVVVMLLLVLGGAGHRRGDDLLQLVWMHDTRTEPKHRRRPLVAAAIGVVQAGVR